MDAFYEQLRITLRLHFRNRMALIYSYLFPTIFLIAFWVLYRHERVPLARHMGELLTVTALGGACFGLPTTMVSERERGVWRRYRLSPARTGTLLAGTVVARYILLVLAAVLQVGLAMIIGMPLPTHPLDLWVTFTFVAFALLGLGLVIATLADNVPAVQALGQCIFLPMLIIGGVAVQLASLPEWALHVSAFFPGRYAVEAMQACVTGDGMPGVRFAMLALFLIGSAGCLAGVKMFRWDAQQRFRDRRGKAWIGAALASWAAVGVLAEAQGRIGPAGSAQTRTAAAPIVPSGPPVSLPAPEAPADPSSPSPDPGSRPASPPAPPEKVPDAPSAPPPAPPSRAPETPSSAGAPSADAPGRERTGPPEPRAGTPPEPEAPAPKPRAAAPPEPPAQSEPPEPGSWQEVTPAHIDQVVFQRLPSDAGVVAPIARLDEPIEPDIEGEIEEVRSRLPTWPPALVNDPVQRVRNVLYVAAVPDVFQMPTERYLPHIAFERLQADVPKGDLIKILFWVATHPSGGDDSAVDQLRAAGLPVNGPGDIEQVRERVMLYALKLLGRLVGKIPA